MHQGQIRQGIAAAAANGDGLDKRLHASIPVKTVFLSDVHLVYDGCMAKELIGFLNHIDPEEIYLVGDFIDGWSFGMTNMRHVGRLFQASSLSTTLRLPILHMVVIQKILRHARKGAFIYYIPGNHDGFLRTLLRPIPDLPEETVDRRLALAEAGTLLSEGLTEEQRQKRREFLELFEDIPMMGRIAVLPDITHKTADNRRLLVTHGDEFDILVKNYRLLSVLSTKLRDQLFSCAEWIDRNDKKWLFRKIGCDLFGFKSDFSPTKKIRGLGSPFDRAVPGMAREYIKARNHSLMQRKQADPAWANEPLFDGCVTGHSHDPLISDEDGIRIFNCGDWVNHGTALVEHENGKIELVKWNPEAGLPHLAPLDRTYSPPLKLAERLKHAQAA
ncbi:MAG: UDP-2,3-diacylglucosamine diphosphatase [Alphaproteobacteria bacterium]|nr:UDP-2,3-diacylglucosamine diphosphatase [Alphaproteobacteria bacterium]